MVAIGRLFYLFFSFSTALWAMPVKQKGKRTFHELSRVDHSPIFCPRKAGLTGSEKPIAFIVLSPWEEEDQATDFPHTRLLLEKFSGYSVVNHRVTPSTFFEEWKIEIKHQHRNKELVIWVLAHGAPAFFFGDEHTRKNEKKFSQLFANHVRSEALKRNLQIKAVVLDSCFSGNEANSQCRQRYLKSPARMLSEYMADIPVYGSLGKSSTVKVEVLDASGNSWILDPSQGGFVSYLNGELNSPYPEQPETLHFSTDFLKRNYFECLGYEEFPETLKQKSPKKLRKVYRSKSSR